MTNELLQPVKITRTAVYIGGIKLPGAIAQDGITVKPGGGRDINRLTVEFLVGHIETLDPTEDPDSQPE